MNTYIALLRGINVGGHNKLPMKELRALLGELGYQNVNTYIQTGNVVFQAEGDDPRKLAEQIGEIIEENYGFKPAVLILTPDELKEAIKSNPFPEAESTPKRLALTFLLSEPSNPDMEVLEDVQKENERFALKGKVFYMHAPDGFGRSKLAEKTGKALGVSMTSRNWRTVQKIMDMVEEYT